MEEKENQKGKQWTLIYSITRFMATTPKMRVFLQFIGPRKQIENSKIEQHKSILIFLFIGKLFQKDGQRFGITIKY